METHKDNKTNVDRIILTSVWRKINKLNLESHYNVPNLEEVVKKLSLF
jgi:hypothetical protein